MQFIPSVDEHVLQGASAAGSRASAAAKVRLDEAFDIKCDTLNIIAIVRQRGGIGPQDFIHTPFEKLSAAGNGAVSTLRDRPSPGGGHRYWVKVKTASHAMVPARNADLSSKKGAAKTLTGGGAPPRSVLKIILRNNTASFQLRIHGASRR